LKTCEWDIEQAESNVRLAIKTMLSLLYVESDCINVALDFLFETKKRTLKYTEEEFIQLMVDGSISVERRIPGNIVLSSEDMGKIESLKKEFKLEDHHDRVNSEFSMDQPNLFDRKSSKTGTNPYIDYSQERPRIKMEFIENVEKIDTGVYGIGISFENHNIIDIYTQNEHSSLFTIYEREIKENMINIRYETRTNEGMLCYEISKDQTETEGTIGALIEGKDGKYYGITCHHCIQSSDIHYILETKIAIL
jgi:hypothetical protein